MMHRVILPFVLVVATALSAMAAPARYSLDRNASSVGFEVQFGNDRITGTMPVGSADMVLDFDQVAGSNVQVTLSADQARANFPFATQALRGKDVLATSQFPQIAFRSTSVQATASGATVRGDITIRGVTRPISLDARIFRQQGTAAGDLSRLSIQLTGSILRSAFGASGFADLVGDRVDLRILARVRRVE